MKTCPECKKKFESKDKRRVYCTKDCERKFNGKKFAKKAKQKKMKQ